MTEILGEGRFLRLLRRNRWEIVERVNARGAVMVVATVPGDEADDAIILVRQWREPLEGFVWELPAGLMDQDGEDEVACARRELVEETGYDSDDARVLWAAPSSPGMTNEDIVFVRARGCARVGDGGGVSGESIEVHVVPFAELERRLNEAREAGDRVDARVYTGAFLGVSWTLGE